MNHGMNHDMNDDTNYDMNALDEYISLFGNPFKQKYNTIMNNVIYMNWPNEEIYELFSEMLKTMVYESD